MKLTPSHLKEEKENKVTNAYSVPDYIETVELLASQLKKAHELLHEIGIEYHGWKDIEDYFNECDPIAKKWVEGE